MSHKATKWIADIAPETLTHGEFRILFHLCDCHNPSMGCFPSQKYLRDVTGMSNGGLNKALAALEEKRLIRRERKHDAVLKQRLATHYLLGFEIDRAQEPTPLSGDGAISTFDGEPSPLSQQSHLHRGGVTIKEEPVKEPVKEPCADGAQDRNFEKTLGTFLKVYPRHGDRGRTEDALRAALGAGADPDQIIAAAKAYAVEQKGNAPRFIAYSENWLEQKRWDRHRIPADPRADPSAVAELRAKNIRAGREWAVRDVSASYARDLIAQGLVTAEQCRGAGISL